MTNPKEKAQRPEWMPYQKYEFTGIGSSNKIRYEIDTWNRAIDAVLEAAEKHSIVFVKKKEKEFIDEMFNCLKEHEQFTFQYDGKSFTIRQYPGGRVMRWYEKIKFERMVSGLSLRQIEKITGLSNPYISQLENGQIKNPSFFHMMKLLDLFNMSPWEIVSKKFSGG